MSLSTNVEYKLSIFYAVQPVSHEDYQITLPNRHALPIDPLLLRKPNKPKSSRYHNKRDWTKPGAQVQYRFCNQLGHHQMKCRSLQIQAPDTWNFFVNIFIM